MELLSRVRIDGDRENIYNFLVKYSELSFPCSKIRRELEKVDGTKRKSSAVELHLRALWEKGLIERSGNPGHYEYKINKCLSKFS